MAATEPERLNLEALVSSDKAPPASFFVEAAGSDGHVLKKNPTLGALLRDFSSILAGESQTSRSIRFSGRFCGFLAMEYKDTILLFCSY